MPQLYAAIEAGARVMRRFMPRWPGDAPRDRYFVERDNNRQELPRGLLRQVFKSGRFQPDHFGTEPAELRLLPVNHQRVS